MNFNMLKLRMLQAELAEQIENQLNSSLINQSIGPHNIKIENENTDNTDAQQLEKTQEEKDFNDVNDYLLFFQNENKRFKSTR
jgi:hypothetical protein